MTENNSSLMHCEVCKGSLGPSGQEVYRLICQGCGQNYFIKLTMEPVPPKLTRNPLALPGKPDAE